MRRLQILGAVFAVALLGISALGASVPSVEAASASTAAAAKWQKRLVDAAKPTPAGVRIRVVVTDDPISATTRSEFTQALAAKQRELVMDREGGRGPMGLRWVLKWNWEPEVHLGACQFRNAAVTVEYLADFAALGGPIAADSAEQAWWNAQLEELFAGRVVALKILRDGAKEIYEKIRLMNSSTCSDLVTRANDIARTHSLEVNARAGASFAAMRDQPGADLSTR